jgi:DNA-binding NarL/FixJ family response regulator
MIDIGIIEDDGYVREQLVHILKSSSKLQPVIWTESAEKFLKYCNLTPKFILLDIGLPGMSGIEAIPKIKDKLPDVEIVILSSFKDNDHIFNALKAGANGYVLKAATLDHIEQTLINLDNGVPALSPAIARRMINYFNQVTTKFKDIDLTSKESETLGYLVNGLSYKLIASKMEISINSVRYHVKNVYKKLHINSRPELIKLYMDGAIKLN